MGCFEDYLNNTSRPLGPLLHPGDRSPTLDLVGLPVSSFDAEPLRRLEIGMPIATRWHAFDLGRFDAAE